MKRVLMPIPSKPMSRKPSGLRRSEEASDTRPARCPPLPGSSGRMRKAPKGVAAECARGVDADQHQDRSPAQGRPDSRLHRTLRSYPGVHARGSVDHTNSPR